MEQTTSEAQDLHPLELADRIDPGDEGSKCVLTIDLVHAADLIRRMHSAGIEQERELATMAGQTAAIGHLSTLVDEQRALLAEVERVCGFDEWGEMIHEGESPLMDRIRQHLETVAAPHTS